ncbi:LysR substrate-binding domain-containing protein [Primorskyibacter aestuariivivens]|uniref:LysR substrate-binding domain-containing protein n=1 Tax=Primorskyibacter aestuariivivens TaxID=1888912 RepID=UPI0022FFE6E6|nr:LysR substrate-binding domain-containing protein [Primorskyibacter aestuariivivens]MDA7428968.1 LysR substrate-binding domain-containing protein [Primorskyibacter aestuariivivens]
MTLSRRLLPSLPGLRALESLDRLGSATAVAEELSLTQSAVSRQLQTLEDQLGVSLLVRARQRITLTEAARTYAAQVRAALDQITNASLQLQVSPTSGGLNLAIQPTFAMRWLVPRLPDFAHRHPDVAISMATRLDPPDFARDGFDAAIRFGSGQWPGVHALLLQREEVLPVCAPALLPEENCDAPKALLSMPFLHIRTRPEGWADWFAGQGMAGVQIPGGGTILDQHATIHQAALHGLGVALLPDYLVREDLATGRLVLACKARPVSLGGNYLTWPEMPAPGPAMIAFRDWLAEQAEGGDGLPR